MQLTSKTFAHNGWIPEKCAFGIKDEETHMALGKNINPQLSWSNTPDGAQSLVLICVDTDVPSSLENFNKEGKTVSANLSRVDFMHSLMVDIPPKDFGVNEAECSDGITPKGKQNPNGPKGSRRGHQNY